MSPQGWIITCVVLYSLYSSGWLTLRTAVTVGFIFAAFVYNLVANQESMLYIPVIQGIHSPDQNPQGLRNPKEQGLEYSEHYLTVPGEEGLEIHGWFLPTPDKATVKTAPTLLFCHENAGNIGLRLEEFRRVGCSLKVNQFVFDYRGYGASKGTQQPNEPGLIADATAALHFLEDKGRREEIDASKIILVGRSLGGAVAVQLAAGLSTKKIDGSVAGVIIENSFTSVEAMVDHMFPFLTPVPASIKAKLLRLRWRSIDVVDRCNFNPISTLFRPHSNSILTPFNVDRITIPICFLSSDEDEIVPNLHMHELKDAATRAAFRELHTFPKATHNDIWMAGGGAYWQAKGAFIAKVLGQQVAGRA